MRLSRNWLMALGLVVILLILGTGCPTKLNRLKPAPTQAPASTPTGDQKQSPPQPAATSTDWIDAAMRSTVKVWVVTDGKDKSGDIKVIGGCSGTIIDPSGVILTNWHCVGHTDEYGPDDSGLGLQNGEMYHSQGIIVVGLTEDPKVEPKPTYLAKVRQGSPSLDVAVAKIYGMLDSSQTLPKRLPLVTSPLGDSDSMKVGDPVNVFGYPGIGGPLVTKTSGSISGFYKIFKDRPDVKVDMFKTDAVIGAGNSGGLATNNKGEDIGIPAYGRSSGGDTLWGIVLVNLAKPYIERAMSDAIDPLPPRLPNTATNRQPTPPPAQPTPPPAQPTPPPASEGAFGSPSFGTDYKDGSGLVGQSTSFPAGTMKVVAEFDAKGMRSGTRWGYVLKIDGDPAIDKADAFKWDTAADTKYTLTWSNSNSPLPGGEYDLSLLINGREVQRGRFKVGGGSPPPTPPPADKGVILSGQVVDADTKRGIDAIVVLLNPGVTIQEWVDADFSEDMMAALAETNPNGTFLTDPPIARGKAYSIAILADGYKPFARDAAIEVAANDPPEIKLNPIALQKQ